MSWETCECQPLILRTASDTFSSSDWKKDVFKTDTEAKQFIRLVQYFSLKKDIDSLVKLRTWYLKTLFSARLKRCIRVLHSKDICENNVGFYIWAQMLAKDIMNGKFSE